MKANKTWSRNIRVLCLLALTISTISIGVFAAYALQSESVPLEVKEPIELLDYPAALSLFPGETEEFTVTVQNTVSINYSVTLTFSLNDTEYQAKYVTFSSESYTVNPGKQTLAAWLKVSSDAPAGSFLISVNLTRRNFVSDAQPTLSPSPSPSFFPSPSSSPSPSPSPSISPSPSSSPSVSPSPSPLPELQLTPSQLLLEGGAKWAANNNSGSALFINWKDNWNAHHLTDGADWGPWPSESSMDNSRSSIAQILGQAGFKVNFTGDIPQNLSGYNLVVVEAYYAVEPRHNALFRDYLANGGGVVILGGVPCYFSVNCKDMWPYRFGGMDLTSLQDWFGCRYYVNTGGTARATVDKPFGTTILNGTTLVASQGYSCAAVSTPSNSTQVIALWDDGAIFAFTHEYGEGRLYYQVSY